ncbi:protein eva-1 homolog A isoform X1 [Pogona vitticeps]
MLCSRGSGVLYPLLVCLPNREASAAEVCYLLSTKQPVLPVDETQKQAFNESMEPESTSTEMALLSNILAAYSFLTENPERAALYFVSGICAGLLLTLLALVLRISCQTDCRPSSKKKPPRDTDTDSSGSDNDSDTTSDLSARRQRRFERTLNMNIFSSAEELERAHRLEERERIIREIWMNGQPDIPGTRSLNRGMCKKKFDTFIPLQHLPGIPWSLIKMSKSTGPRTEPWGTTLITSTQYEKEPLIIILVLLVTEPGQDENRQATIITAFLAWE